MSRFTIPRNDDALFWASLGLESELGLVRSIELENEDRDLSPRSSILGVNADKSGVPRSETGDIGDTGIYGDGDTWDGPGSPGLKMSLKKSS